jgi:hypothetical protein
MFGDSISAWVRVNHRSGGLAYAVRAAETKWLLNEKMQWLTRDKWKRSGLERLEEVCTLKTSFNSIYLDELGRVEFQLSRGETQVYKQIGTNGEAIESTGGEL